MKSISLDSPESSDTTAATAATHIRPTGSGPTLSSVGKTETGGRRYGGLLNVLRTRVSSANLIPITSPSSSSTTTSSSGGPIRMMAPPNTVNIGATSAPASYNQCKLFSEKPKFVEFVVLSFCTLPSSTLMLVFFTQ